MKPIVTRTDGGVVERAERRDKIIGLSLIAGTILIFLRLLWSEGYIQILKEELCEVVAASFNVVLHCFAAFW